ncbi:dTDP-Rha--alpha-D-GlcNAc-pyrophosphate polyprenol alpha-3-L-rhamnosyltransferase, partial [Pseudomonas aeruginosa]
ARSIPRIRNGIAHALLGSIWPSNPWTKSYLDDRDMSSERPAGWLSGSCLLVRRDAFDSINGFDEGYFMY